MNKSRLVAGIDIGSSKITTLIAQVTTDQVTFEDSISVVGVAIADAHGVKKGQIVDIEEAVEAMIVSVEKAERMAGYNLSSAYVSVGGGHISSQNSQGVVAVSDPQGEVSIDDVDRVIEAARAISLSESREIIHVLPREYTVDGEKGVRDPVGMSGVRLEVETHLITASSSALKNLSKAVAEVGVDIEDMVFSGLSSAEAVLTETEKELGCVLIDIGGESTSIAAYVDKAIAYSGTIPIGARNVTSDLAIGLRVSLDAAEKIKLGLSEEETKQKKDERLKDQIEISKYAGKEEKTVSRRTVVEGIIKPRLNEIFTMVKLDLDRARVINKIPSGAIITGGGAATVGAAESAKRMMGLPVRVGIPKGISGLIDDIMSPAFATPVGLILYGAQRPSSGRGSKILGLGKFAKKLRIPAKGTIGKLFESIRNLLP